MKNILCVRLDNVGDLLMTIPAIRAIKKAGNRITLLCSSDVEKITPYISEIDDTIVLNAPWIKTSNFSNVFEIINKVKAKKFDEAIIFTVFSQNALPAALFCYLSGIPKRAAFNHENPYDLLTHWIPDPEPEMFIKHEVQRQIDLVTSLSYTTNNSLLNLQIPQKDIENIQFVLQKNKINLYKPWIIIHPGASDKQRQYNIETYAKIASYLHSSLHMQVLITGNEKEKNICDFIVKFTNNTSVSLAGQISLLELCALIKLAPLIITNNTGPMHIADAVNTPVICFYANINLQHVPWQVKNKTFLFDVSCKNCQRKICNKEHIKNKKIEFSEIIKTVRAFLADRYSFINTMYA